MVSRSRKKRLDKRILEHELVPEHRILSLEEAAELLRTLSIKPNQLPRISINDPIVQLLGAKPGDIIEIKRKSPTAGESLYYRIVVVF
ncbi:MAG: DNA-directed RNA polymerase subunit H [Desulfurococcales archaeon]|nr:DNA-directed RNA polymerase subunit H [Desulfurococcales archaeon]